MLSVVRHFRTTDFLFYNERRYIMNTFFIADLHLGHKNILSYDNRPFTDIETHDNYIISKWNETVGFDDEVWLLGDVSWHSSTKTIDFLKNLNGIKHLIIGNHDKKLLRNRDFQSQFQSVQDYKELQITKSDGQGSELLVLSHYPIPCFNRHYYGAYHFYGHVHDSYEWNMLEHLRRQFEELYTQPCNMINIGAMLPYMNYTPRTFNEIIEKYDVFRQKTITIE